VVYFGEKYLADTDHQEIFPVMFASEDKPWFEVYQAAMLELDHQKLPGRIVVAKEAVRLRLEEIQGDSDHHAERQQIEDALSCLRTLEREK
jgi:hypothetical protein